MSDLSSVLTQARESIESVKTVHELEQLRAQFLGKKSILTEQLKQIAHLSPEEKRTIGQTINQAKNELQELFAMHLQRVQQLEIDRALSANQVDVTLTGRGQVYGNLHPVTQTRQWIEDFFIAQGFEIVTGPEIEDEYHNFSALNIPDFHPAREMHDTFYLDEAHLLRTHTSPVQIRAMKERKPPFRLIAPGRVYRCDFDVTHTPMFHQVEGMMVDEHISFADLKGVLEVFLQQFFQSDLNVRFRPAYFPFTEPSAEVDISCVQCSGKGCRVCKHTGWLEILGCGMIHPRVLEAVSIDSKQYHGFAFGVGIDRLTMLKYGIPDLRSLFENDLRLLQQF